MLNFVIDEHFIKTPFRIDGAFNKNAKKDVRNNFRFEVHLLEITVFSENIHMFVLLKTFNIRRPDRKNKTKLNLFIL